MSGTRGNLALIPARGGSKGIPKKNIRLLAGKPLIAYAIETALASRLIDRVIVSTDDQEIAKIARQFGAEVPFVRPEELAQDGSPEWLTWQHAIRWVESAAEGGKINAFVCIPPTSPLRAVKDVDACIKLLLESDADMVITARPAQRNPYFNMVVLDEEGYARYVLKSEGPLHHRQVAPQIFDMTTVAYATYPEYVLRASSVFEGKVMAVMVPEERALDIDTELDLQFAEFLLSQPSGNG